MERPDWKPGDTIRSITEVSGIYLEAAQLCLAETVSFVKVKAAVGLSRIDGWLCDYGSED